ncbi:ABC transporter substrate-binding protein [Catenovulum sediminis]|uniref:ABC transporter substrate-binding protein n=1 Tax=Catenovulum sediminis TaxID=1740262 RepID=UPI00117D3766|nr:ABC transporter substrate-binding protein [Catenovulum sediminis]
MIHLFKTRRLALGLAFSLCFCVKLFAQDTVRLQLKWNHQFQFAGYYMALEKGFYQQKNLNVEILEGNKTASPR